VLVRFDLNLDGMLIVTAVERATSLEKRLTIKNAVTQFRATSRDEAKAKLASMFGTVDETEHEIQPIEPPVDVELQTAIGQARDLIAKSRKLAASAGREDADEIGELSDELEAAVVRQALDAIREISEKLEDVVFYLEDA
jgi:molecular chaperone DnaK (HSP70)